MIGCEATTDWLILKVVSEISKLADNNGMLQISQGKHYFKAIYEDSISSEYV